jgi:hypothetical protein
MDHANRVGDKPIQIPVDTSQHRLKEAESGSKTDQVGKLLGQLNKDSKYLDSGMSITDFFQSVKAVVLSALGINHLTDRDQKVVQYAKKTMQVFQQAIGSNHAKLNEAHGHFENMSRLIGDRSSRVHQELLKQELKENPVLAAVVREFEKTSGNNKHLNFADVVKLKTYLSANAGPLTINKLFEDMHGKLSIKTPSLNQKHANMTEQKNEAYRLGKQLEYEGKFDELVKVKGEVNKINKELSALEAKGNTELTNSPRLNSVVKYIEKEAGIEMHLSHVIKLEKFLGTNNSMVALRDFVQKELKVKMPGNSATEIRQKITNLENREKEINATSSDQLSDGIRQAELIIIKGEEMKLLKELGAKI